MTTMIKDGLGPISANTIESIETRLSIELPTSYRMFLEKYNGGYPEPDGFMFKDESSGSSVDRFLGIDVGPHSNLENYLAVYDGRIPINMFPIAHDPGGNLVLICLSGNKKDKIYFWDHECEADGWEPDKSNVHLVADDFDEFISSLFEVEI